MKKTFIFFLTIYIAMSGYAQEPREGQNPLDARKATENREQLQQQLDGRAGQMDGVAVRKNGGDDFNRRIESIDRQIDALKKDIHDMYVRNGGEDWNRNKEKQSAALATLQGETKALRDSIAEISRRVALLEEECRWVSDLYRYYAENDIDTLYAHVDLASLQVHKSILGNDYPKGMDALQTLLECSEVLKKAYEERRNNSALESLKKLAPSKKRDDLSDLLWAHKDITIEVDAWLSNPGQNHSLYETMAFLADLNENYVINLNVDYPYLAKKVREAVELPRKRQ